MIFFVKHDNHVEFRDSLYFTVIYVPWSICIENQWSVYYNDYGNEPFKYAQVYVWKHGTDEGLSPKNVLHSLYFLHCICGFWTITLWEQLAYFSCADLICFFVIWTIFGSLHHHRIWCTLLELGLCLALRFLVSSVILYLYKFKINKLHYLFYFLYNCIN